MARIVIHQCDKCGATNSTKESFQLFELGVSCNLIYPTIVSTKTECLPKQHWCRDCLNGSALLGITDKMLEERRVNSMPPPVPATLEDMIREIAEEAGAESAMETLRNR